MKQIEDSVGPQFNWPAPNIKLTARQQPPHIPLYLLVRIFIVVVAGPPRSLEFDQ